MRVRIPSTRKKLQLQKTLIYLHSHLFIHKKFIAMKKGMILFLILALSMVSISASASAYSESKKETTASVKESVSIGQNVSVNTHFETVKISPVFADMITPEDIICMRSDYLSPVKGATDYIFNYKFTYTGNKFRPNSIREDEDWV